ncbi:hypothetical protein [Flavobacterium sedimenticola]|uniref:Uncharacterized protein n=1 Tax=Flavobacterium sedimenticola TaxID=3043286 RepID=A0ABT6XQG2_9FLAO|nr:hypothetical protein [Flavobacterium sedimenticola]MDI9257316.1 hypothetical protein [Flavobacterium sedimenticola]
MLSRKVNLQEELLSERKKSQSEADVLSQVLSVLAENEKARAAISETLHTKSSTKSNALQFDLLETDRIFHLDHIRTICIDYRLRFLDSSIFKNDIPEEAISKIRMLEREHNTSLEGFKIIAPSKAFHLLNYDDPLLFVPIGNDYYYLVHQWGTEINPWRKLLVLPFRNLGSFTLTAILFSILIALLVPENNLSKSVPMASFIVFLFAFKSIFAVFAYYFFMMGKNFNEEIWKREYYNN